MRNRISLAVWQEQVRQWKREKSDHAYREAHKYDGLDECRKNVIKCGCLKKLKYCVSTKED